MFIVRGNTFAVGLILTAVFCGQTSAAPPTIEQVDAALDIAEEAARNGLTELSIEAIRRALQYGMPTILQDTVDRTPRLGILVDTITPTPKSPEELIQIRVPECIFRLSQQWRTDAAAESVYLALRDVVLPPAVPGKAILYSVPMKINPAQPDRLPAPRSVAGELVTWAERANRLKDLEAYVLSHPAAETIEAGVLLMMCASIQGNADDISEYANRLSARYGDGTSRNAAEMIAFVGASLAGTEQHSEAAAALLEIAGRTISKIDTLTPATNSPAGAALLSAARLRFSIDQTEQAVDLLSAYMQTKIRGRHGIASRGLEDRRTQTVARELFGRHLNEYAKEVFTAEDFRRLQQRYTLIDEPVEIKDASTQQPDREFRIVPADSEHVAKLQPSTIQFCVLDTAAQQSSTLFYLPDFRSVIAPAVSPDGTEVAFAATFPGEAVTSDTRLYVANIDGSAIRCLGRGTLPSWSPEGRRIAFSSYSPNRGVWITRVDLDDRMLVDETGWGGCWSPDGRMIAYTKLVDRRWDFVVYDIVEDEVFSIFGPRPPSFASIYGGFNWTNDSRQLIFKSTRDAADSNSSTYRLFRADVFGQNPLRDVFVHRGYISDSIACPDSDNATVVAFRKTGRKTESLYRVGPSVNDTPQYLKGQNAGHRNSAVAECGTPKLS